MPPAPPASYGADRDGLICAFHLTPEGPGRQLASAAEALALLGPERRPAQGFVWLHMNLSHAAAQPWLRAHSGLDESFYEAWSQGSRSTRIERDGESLYAVINDVAFDFGFDAGDVATLWMGVQPGLVVTARTHPLRSVDRLRMAVKRGEALASSVALLVHLLQDQADELQRIVRATVERIDDIEDALLARHGAGAERFDTELGRLRRLTVRLQRLLAPEPGALMRTLARPPAWVGEADRQQLLRASEEFGVVLRDVAALQDRIKLLLDESAARVAQQNNRSLFTLTMVTVLALPINLVSGLFGMNVGGIPLAGHGRGFWIMVAFIATLTGLIAGFALRGLRARG
jgi:zinc transporter